MTALVCAALLVLPAVPLAAGATASEPGLHATKQSTSGSGGREISRGDLGPTGYYLTRTTTAYAAGRYLTVWEEDRLGYGHAVFGILTDTLGTALTPEPFVVVPMSYFGPMFLVGTGDGFALFRDDYAGGPELFRLDANGSVLERHDLNFPLARARGIAWNGAEFLMTHSDGGRLVASILTAEGMPNAGPFDLAPDNTGHTTTANGSTFKVLTNERSIWYLHTITDGGVERSQQTALNGAATVVFSEAADGSTVILWSETSTDVSRLFLSSAENPTAPIELVVSAERLQALAIEQTSLGFLAVWTADARDDSRRTLYSIELGATGVPTTAPRLLATAALTGILERVIVASGGGTIALNHSFDYNSFREQVVLTTVRSGHGPVSQLLSLARPRQIEPAISEAVSGRMLTLWTSIRDTGSVAGILTDGSAAQPVAIPGWLASRELPSNGEEWLVLHRIQSTLYASRIDVATGALVGEPILLDPIVYDWFTSTASAIWTGANWLIVWPAGNNMRTATISRSGRLSPYRELAPSTPLPPHYERLPSSLALASDGDDILLAWSEWHAPPCMMPICGFGELKTFATRLTPHGHLVDPSPTPLPDGGLTVSVASSGREFAVLSGATISIVRTNGSAPQSIASKTLRGENARSDIAWDGDDYVTALRFRHFDWYLTVTRFNRSLDQTSETRWTRTLPPDMEEGAAPSIAAAPGDDILIVLQEGTLLRGAGVVEYRERELVDPPPAPHRRAVRR